MITPIPDASVTPEEEAAVTREEIVATTVFLRLYATLAPESKMRALLAADLTAISQAISETYTHAFNAGYRKAVDDETARNVVQVEAANRTASKIIQTATEVEAARRAGR